MTDMELLERLGDIRERYILEAHEEEKVKRLSLNRMWLVAALIALMLLLVGCVAYTQGWFVDFFANRSETPLTDSQIELIQENEQIINETQTRNGWTVELRSALTDGNKAYLILGIAAPEGIDLIIEPVEGEYRERISLYQEGFPVGTLERPEGVGLLAVTTSWQDDGDGLDNTHNYVIEIEPDLSACTAEPFGPEAEWSIRFDQIVRSYDDEEYKQHLLDTKYKGDYGVMFTHEETQRIHQEEVLAEGDWEFTVTFADQEQNKQENELLKAPIELEADILRRYGDEIWETAYFREDITVTSVLLQPLSINVTYADCDGSPLLWFRDENLFVEEDVYPCAVMRDGTVMTLRGWASGSDGHMLLESEVPVIWEEADHIRFADGTKLYMDGTVEYGPEPEAPAAAAAYRDIPSETGVYAYYADFDEDGMEDMAVWYDGAFHTLCLLNEQGEVKTEITLEAGMDIYETYNQRAAEIKWEPNLIKLSETVEDVEYFRIFRAAEEGLVLSVGVKHDPGGAQSQWFQAAMEGNEETWEPITEEAYRRILEDYQVRAYRLRPIAE